MAQHPVHVYNAQLEFEQVRQAACSPLSSAARYDSLRRRYPARQSDQPARYNRTIDAPAWPLMDGKARRIHPGCSMDIPSFTSPLGSPHRPNPQLNGLDLTDSEKERISEMFRAHACDNVLSRSSFNDFLLEGFAYSFTTRENQMDSRQHIRAALSQLEADFSSPIFTQAWLYFDQERNNGLTLRDVGEVLSSVKQPGTASRFVFALADINANGSLSSEELLHFFSHFIELARVLGTGVLALERAFLISNQGWDIESYNEQHRKIESTMEQASKVVAEQLHTTFDVLDSNNDGRITRSEWTQGLAYLPEMYMKILLLCQGILCPRNLKFDEF